MSKIYKPHINGKPKRQGTHQCHYLGPIVVVVAEKLDPIVGQLCFRRNFQTARNRQKGTIEMSSGGQKIVERSNGLAGNGLNYQKIKKNTVFHFGRRRLAGPILARLPDVGLETSRPASSGCPPPLCPARVAGGRPVVPPLVQTPTARKWFKNDLTRCS